MRPKTTEGKRGRTSGREALLPPDVPFHFRYPP